MIPLKDFMLIFTETLAIVSFAFYVYTRLYILKREVGSNRYKHHVIQMHNLRIALVLIAATIASAFLLIFIRSFS